MKFLNPSPTNLTISPPTSRAVLIAFINLSPASLGPPPRIREYRRSPTKVPMTSPNIVPRTGMGIKVPRNPPRAAPNPLNSAWPGGSPASREDTATTIGPRIGTLLNPLAIPFIAMIPCLPRTLVASLLGTFFSPPLAILLPLSVPPREPVCGLDTICPFLSALSTAAFACLGVFPLSIAFS